MTFAPAPGRAWTIHRTLSGRPREVLELLTVPEAIARWAPVPFEVVELDKGRLAAGGRARVCGHLAGRPVEFEVRVLQADERRLMLTAEGPITFDVDYLLSPHEAGSDLSASVTVRGSGLIGRAIAAAASALLAGGALAGTIGRLEEELTPAPVG
jgi:hypothetical protein